MDVYELYEGVEAANTSQRLLERNPLLSYIGVDPYVKNDGLYEDPVAAPKAYKGIGIRVHQIAKWNRITSLEM